MFNTLVPMAPECVCMHLSIIINLFHYPVHNMPFNVSLLFTHFHSMPSHSFLQTFSTLHFPEFCVCFCFLRCFLAFCSYHFQQNICFQEYTVTPLFDFAFHFISFRCVPAKRRSKEHAYNLQHTHEAQGAVLKKSWLKENVSKASIKPTILIPTLM